MKKFRLYFLIIMLIELFSLVGFMVPEFRDIAFFVILAVTVLLAVEKLDYGVLIVLTELFIASKGYLFFYEYEGMVISLRIALFFVVMCVWLGKVVVNWMSFENAKELMPDWEKFKDVPGKLKQEALKLPQKTRAHKSVAFYFALLFIFIAWGVVNGYLNHHSLTDIFFDANGWVYFGIVFPLYYIFRHDHEGAIRQSRLLEHVSYVFAAAVSWLVFKTLVLLYIFSHQISGLTEMVYRWVRVTGVGEITTMTGGFSRIFFQSHVYVFIALFVTLALALHYHQERQKKALLHCYIATLLLMSVVVVSLSRSFGVGMGAGLLVYWFIGLLFLKLKWKTVLYNIMLLIGASIGAVALIATIVLFPLPRPSVQLSGDLLRERVSGDEAAVSSRWNLLPPLWAEIKKDPIKGQGFGASVMYISNDPRVREISPDGTYTTTAFEWGWLDIWLKLGIFGLLAYIALLVKIIIDGLRITHSTQPIAQNNELSRLLTISLLSGIVFIAVTNVFSPYLNHPLGIGYVVLISVMFLKKK